MLNPARGNERYSNRWQTRREIRAEGKKGQWIENSKGHQDQGLDIVIETAIVVERKRSTNGTMIDRDRIGESCREKK